MSHSLLDMAHAFIQTGELNDALDALNQHLDTAPSDEAARRLRAQVLARTLTKDNLRAALDDLDRLTTPTPDDRLWRSIILEYLGDVEGAVAVIAQLHSADTTDERVAERYFHLLMRQRRFEEAQALLKVMPRTWDWLQRAGDLASESGHDEQALAYYSQALDHLETRFNVALDAFARSIKANILASRAQVHATLGRFPQAEADYAAAQELIPDDPVFPFWRGLIAADMGDHEQAVTLCRAALAKANAALRAQMEAMLREIERYDPIARALLG